MNPDVEWNEAKRLENNIRDRGVDFREAALIFDQLVAEEIDERRAYGETRYRALGHVEG